MTKEQLIEIAKVGFPDRVKEYINWDNLERIHMSGVYRLYDKDTPFNLVLPKESVLSISIQEGNEIYIDSHRKAFNQHAAIKKMEELGLITNEKNNDGPRIKQGVKLLIYELESLVKEDQKNGYEASEKGDKYIQARCAARINAFEFVTEKLNNILKENH